MNIKTFKLSLGTGTCSKCGRSDMECLNVSKAVVFQIIICKECALVSLFTAMDAVQFIFENKTIEGFESGEPAAAVES